MATNQSQVSPEEGLVSQPFLLAGEWGVEEGILLGRNITFFWRKLQGKGSPESEDEIMERKENEKRGKRREGTERKR